MNLENAVLFVHTNSFELKLAGVKQAQARELVYVWRELRRIAKRVTDDSELPVGKLARLHRLAHWAERNVAGLSYPPGWCADEPA